MRDYSNRTTVSMERIILRGIDGQDTRQETPYIHL